MTLSEKALQEPPEARLIPLKALSKAAREDTLLVHEIYTSVQGESTWAGVPCVFVRTTACHLRCRYCDTEHAFHDGTARTIDDVIAEVALQGIPLVELTGGEPLLQRATLPLLTRLCDAGHTVLLETSGGVTTEGVDKRVRVILDVKTPGSGESARVVWSNLERLQPHDEVKFVLCSEADYEWAKDVLKTRHIPRGVTILFSSAFGELEPARLAEWIVRDRLPVRFQLQMHKVLWGERQGV